MRILSFIAILSIKNMNTLPPNRHKTQLPSPKSSKIKINENKKGMRGRSGLNPPPRKE